MAYIINIETSTKVCSVTLAHGTDILFNRENRTDAHHASILGIFVSEAMMFSREHGFLPDAVAVSSGPGSYTGLRIGVSEAKGLCFGLNIPLIAVPSLELMADAVVRSELQADFFIPMIDARRMEVYATIYNPHMQLLEEVSAKIIDEHSFSGYLAGGKALFFGDGAEKCRSVIRSDNARFLENICPLASSMVFLSEKAYRKKQWEDPAYFEPFYLKEFIATVAKNKVLGINKKTD